MKKNIFNNFLIVVLIQSVVLFDYPGLILGDSSKLESNSQAAGSFINAPLIREISFSKFDSSFFLILITSIIIVGILLFAIWQIFRSKRQF